MNRTTKEEGNQSNILATVEEQKTNGMNNSEQLQDVHVYRMRLPDHDCPWGKRAVDLLEARGIAYQDHALTSQEAVDSLKQRWDVATTPQIFSGDHRIGGYSELATLLGEKPEKADVSYIPVIAVFGTTLLMALVMQESGLRQFMGFSICALSMLKLMDVESFAASFIKYDLVSQRWPTWARIYPGVELLIGLGFLMTPPPTLAGWAALVIALPGMWSVIKAIYIDKLALNCACVGGNTKTPLGIISFTEYAILAAMGLITALNLMA
tara:strand:+ start:352 stop:1152 length:801 start_codon:yes stop_codon:yes gene_type:complete